jgi:hypothetical protein
VSISAAGITTIGQTWGEGLGLAYGAARNDTGTILVARRIGFAAPKIADREELHKEVFPLAHD